MKNREEFERVPVEKREKVIEYSQEIEGKTIRKMRENYKNKRLKNLKNRSAQCQFRLMALFCVCSICSIKLCFDNLI